MQRPFLALAAANGLLLLGALATGLPIAADPGGHRSILPPLMAIAPATTAATHLLGSGVLARRARRIDRGVRDGGMPDWVATHARKNRAKAARFEIGGTAAVAGAALVWAGLGPWPGLMAWGLAAGFDLAGMGIEGVAIASQGRWLGSVEARVGRSNAATVAGVSGP